MEEMNEEEAISGDDDPIEGSSVEEVASLKATLSENEVLEAEVSEDKVPLPSEPQIKSKSKKQKQKQKKVLDIVNGSCSEPEVVNEFLKTVDESSDDEINRKSDKGEE